MPSDALTLAVSTGLGVSVVAGIVSGICYVLVHGYNFTRRRSRDSSSPWKCNICGGHFRSIDGVLETTKVVTCAKCRHRVCRNRCSSRERLNEGWVCQLCQRNTESWFKGILSAIQPNSKRGIHFRSKMNSPNRIDEIDEDLEILRKREKEQVRDFIERLVSAMLGGGVDDTCITKLYNDNHYDTMFTKYHADLSDALTELGSAIHISIANLPVTGQSPCAAHASLKQLIQRIIQEAIDLPKLKKVEEHPAAPEDGSTRTYEDLLATAVLNKVIQTYQDDVPSSSASVSSRVSSSSKGPKDNKEYFFGSETLDSKWKIPAGSVQDAETTSLSSLEEWVKSDSTIGSTKYVDHMSLTIKQHIEEVSAGEESEPDESEPLYIRTSSLLSQDDDSDWQENWYLQKRKFNGTHSPVPVPMLVPNPTNDAKVLIGDKEAEDTSDLSDIASDYGDTESAPSINSILVDSKTIIGGQNLMNFDGIRGNESEEEVVRGDEEDQTIMNGDDSVAKEESHVEENGVKEGTSDVKEMFDDSSLLSLESQIEQDTEYTEKYASLPRTIVKTPQPKPRNTGQTNGVNKVDNDASTAYTDAKTGSKSETEIYSDSDDQEIHIEGRYSAREKEKWKHPVPMKYNPYSKENIERRIGSTSSSTNSLSMKPNLQELLDTDRKKVKNHRFGRDYYIRAASKPQGTRKTNGYGSDSNVVEHSSLRSPENDEVDGGDIIVKAMPAKVEDDSTQTDPQISQFTSLESDKEKVTNSLEISSDSDLSIERVYNPQTGRITEKFGDSCKEFQNETQEEPQLIKYSKQEMEFVQNSPVDENQNITDKKRQFLRSLTMSDDEFSIKSPDSLTELTDSENVQDQLVPSKIKKYEQITQCTVKDVILKPQPAIRTLKSNHQQAENEENMMITNILDEYEDSTKDTTSGTKTPDFSEEDIPMDNVTPDISIEPSVGYETQTSCTHSPLDTDTEILDLKDKHIVKHVLCEISKSYPNLTKISSAKEEPRPVSVASGIINHKENIEVSSLPSVQDLKKKFESEEVQKNRIKQDKQVYSLTARSIPREFRQELKQQEDKMQNGSTPYINEAEVLKSGFQEESLEEPSEALLKTKSAIEYFENLQKQ